MKKIEEAKIEEIRNKNDIVDVMSNYLSLIKKGKNYVCLCPFHNDTNPSMVVSQEKQIYKCFSCDAGGNVISFVQNYEKISFVEALIKLASSAGIELDIDKYDASNTTGSEYKTYYKMNNEASNLFEYLLLENRNDQSMKFLKDRDINDEIAKVFKIGYASTNNVVTNLLKGKDYDLNAAVEIGLLSLKDNAYHDTYQNRFTYAISDLNNNIVGFTCRAIGDATPKYINSLESKIFNKSSILYNINNAKDTIKQTKSVYILEGPHDVIAFYRAGIKNVVATMGTAFTKEHLALLKSIGVNQVILGFDGDAAGQHATYNAITILTNAKMNIKYLSFENKDPDEYLKEYGYQKLIDLISKPLSAIEFKIQYEFNQVNVNNYLDKKNIVIKIVNDLNNVLDEFDKEYYYNYLANLSGISYELISSFANNTNYTAQAKSKVQVQPRVMNERSDVDNASVNIIYFIMNDNKYFKIFNEEIGTFINQYYRRLYNVIAAYYIDNELFSISDTSNLKADTEIITKLMQILLSFEYDIYNDEQIFLDSIATLKLESQYLELAQLNKELISVANPIHKAKISQDILRITEYINQEKRMKFNK